MRHNTIRRMIRLALLGACGLLAARARAAQEPDQSSWTHRTAQAVRHDAHEIGQQSKNAYHDVAHAVRHRAPKAAHALKPTPAEKTDIHDQFHAAGRSIKHSGRAVWHATRDTALSIGHHVRAAFDHLMGH